MDLPDLEMLPKVTLLLLVIPTLIVTLHHFDVAFGGVIMQNSFILTYSHSSASPSIASKPYTARLNIAKNNSAF